METKPLYRPVTRVTSGHPAKAPRRRGMSEARRAELLAYVDRQQELIDRARYHGWTRRDLIFLINAHLWDIGQRLHRQPARRQAQR